MMIEVSLIRESAQIRAARLPRSLRGLDERATRSFLEEIADAFDGLCNERDKLLEEVESLRATRDPDALTLESISNTLLAANRAGEDLVAEATQKAAQILAKADTERGRIVEEMRTAAADAEHEVNAERTKLEEERQGLQAEKDLWPTQVESERATLLAEARAKAEEIVAAAQARLVMLREEAAELQAFTTAKRNEFIDLTRATLERLDELDVEAGAREPQILEDLRPAHDGGGTTADRSTMTAPRADLESPSVARRSATAGKAVTNRDVPTV
jgi:cell division septum initiation protein DivIVA